MQAFEREIPTFSVSQYVGFINEITSALPVFVEGEVSNFRDIPGRKFCYFDIKDETAVAKCFQGFWHSKKVSLENGATVKIFGNPVLQKNGSLVIDVKEVFLVGDGVLRKKYQELKKRLEKEGLFDLETKKELPNFPTRIGLIAGKNSSAYHDVISEISERWGNVEVFFFGAKVQGVNAKKEIMEAIKYFNGRKNVDVLIIARGGGSSEDLQAFDSEEVVREIFASKIPTVSAVGHEDHWTLADFVADLRAKTPTKAAQMVVPYSVEILERLEFFTTRIRGLSRSKLNELTKNIDFLSEQLLLRIRENFFEISQRIKDKESEALICVETKISEKQVELSKFEKILTILNPESILARGYGVIEKKGKRVVNIKQVKVGDEISIRLQNGEIKSKIQEVGPT